MALFESYGCCFIRVPITVQIVDSEWKTEYAFLWNMSVYVIYGEKRDVVRQTELRSVSGGKKCGKTNMFFLGM